MTEQSIKPFGTENWRAANTHKAGGGVKGVQDSQEGVTHALSVLRLLLPGAAPDF